MPATEQEAIERDRNAPHRLHLLRRLQPGGRLLEVGPMTGGFLALARRAGYEPSAVELDPDCCAFIERVLELPATQSDDPAAAIDGPYDAIALFHVIEHLPDPAAFLASAADALAPGGVALIVAPNPEALQRRALGGLWAHVDAPRHLALIPPGALVREGARVGLETALVTASDEDARRSNGFGWSESLAACARRRRAVAGLRRVGHGVTAALAPIERRRMRGASYTVALRRPRRGQRQRDSSAS